MTLLMRRGGLRMGQATHNFFWSLAVLLSVFRASAWLILTFAVLLSGAVAPAFAFDIQNREVNHQWSPTPCLRAVQRTDRTLFIDMDPGGNGSLIPHVYYFSRGGRMPTGQRINATELQNRCGYLDVTIEREFGAVAFYGSQSYYGLVWKAREAADGQLFRYEFAFKGTFNKTYIADTARDIQAPTVTITGVPTRASEPFTVTYSFDEDITDFDLTDINAGLTNATAANFATTTANRVFTAEITPDGAGNVIVGLAAGAARDNTRNRGLAGNSSNRSEAAANQTVVIAPEIAVTSSESRALADDGTDAQGDEPTGSANTVTYTVSNTGFANLTLAKAAASNATNVTVGTISDPGKTTLAPNDTTTFTVQYTPTAAGAFSFELSFTNNDADENPFNFTVSGVGTDKDDEAPVITVPGDFSVTTDDGKNTAKVDFTGARAATATDNDGKTPTLTYAPASGHAFPLGETTVTATAEDKHGNKATATFKVTVVDKQVPAFTGFPADQMIKVDYPQTGAVATWKEPGVADNVPGATVKQIAGPASGSTFPLGATTVTYKATDVAKNEVTKSFTVTVEQIAPGSVSFVVNAAADGAFRFTSAEPALNLTVDAKGGSGKSDVILIRPGSYDLSFAEPDGVGIASAACTPGASKLDAETKKGTIVLVSGVAVTCTIDALDSRKVTVGQIGSFMGARSGLIISHVPALGRRLDRLNGRTAATGISGFGLAFSHPGLPFSARLGRDGGDFSWSLQNARAGIARTALTADPGAIAAALGIPRSDDAVNKNPADNLADSIAAGNNLANRSLARNAARARAGYALTSAAPLAYWKKGGQAWDPASDATSDALSSGASLALAGEGGTEADPDPDPMTRRFDVWAEGKYTAFSATGGKGRFAIVHAGADYLVNRNLLLGFGLQGDWTAMDASNGGRVSGYGFMAGPYATARFAEGFYGDARIAWGQSFNKVSPFATYTDPVRTSRWLASAALIGETDWNNIGIRPELRLSWFRERSKAYVDSLGVAIPAVTVETGTLEFGPTFTLQTFELDFGMLLTPHLTLEGIWTFAQTNTATTASNQPGLGRTGVRGRIEAGLSLAGKDGASMTVSAFHDGLGNSDFSAWGGKLNLSKPF